MASVEVNLGCSPIHAYLLSKYTLGLSFKFVSAVSMTPQFHAHYISHKDISNILAKGVTSILMSVFACSIVALSLAIACKDMKVGVNSLHKYT